jgi:hypothetical protein
LLLRKEVLDLFDDLRLLLCVAARKEKRLVVSSDYDMIIGISKLFEVMQQVYCCEGSLLVVDLKGNAPIIVTPIQKRKVILPVFLFLQGCLGRNKREPLGFYWE